MLNIDGSRNEEAIARVVKLGRESQESLARKELAKMKSTQAKGPTKGSPAKKGDA